MAKATAGVKTVMTVSPRARYSAIDITGAAPATGGDLAGALAELAGQQGSPVKSAGTWQSRHRTYRR